MQPPPCPPNPPTSGGCGVWGETIHNLRVNHTIKNGFGITELPPIHIYHNSQNPYPSMDIALNIS